MPQPNNDNLQTLLKQGYEFLERGQYPEAITSYDKALAIKPDYYDAWYYKGYALGKFR